MRRAEAKKLGRFQLEQAAGMEEVTLSPEPPSSSEQSKLDETIAYCEENGEDVQVG